MSKITSTQASLLARMKEITTDDGWCLLSNFGCRWSTMNALVTKGLVETHRCAGLTEYRAL